MRFTIQRVSKATCRVEDKITGQIENGLLIFVGFTNGDNPGMLPDAVRKCKELRIFPDENGKLNKSLVEIEGSILLISQFTLYANCSRGRRPDFTKAALPELAKSLYGELIKAFNDSGINTQTGIFAADMQVSLVNEGPITINLEW